MHPNVHCLPSTVDLEHFLPARVPGLEAQDQAHLNKPRIGYYAVIDERFEPGSSATSLGSSQTGRS